MRMKDMMVQLKEGQRQKVLLALAKLSIERPGWLWAIEQVAVKMDNLNEQGKPDMLYEFRRIHDPKGRPEMGVQEDETKRAATYARIVRTI